MKNIREIKDFYLAAYFLASGLEMLEHRREGGITVFHFEDGETLKGLKDQYYNNNGLVKPKHYGACLKSLKSIIHNAASESEVNNELQTKSAVD
ncbi:MAG: hypothetical protein CMF23_07950 [Ignavibacteriae bacterium]|nr:hypothetical protein [Ignavibacteriota bacterium]